MHSLLDVQYGPLLAHRLDLYIPDGDDKAVKHALVVFVHGGAWRA